jgi:hypothetical protein
MMIPRREIVADSRQSETPLAEAKNGCLDHLRHVTVFGYSNKKLKTLRSNEITLIQIAAKPNVSAKPLDNIAF